jgi:hypothetical protein
MGQERRRTALTAGVAVALMAAVAAGCGDDDGGKEAAAPAAKPATTAAPAPAATTPAETTPEAETPPAPTNISDPVRRAAAVVRAQKGGLAVSVTGTMKAKGLSSKISGHGEIDRRTHRGTFTTTTGLGGQKFDVRSVMDGHVVYLTSDAFKGRLEGGKSWMKIDLAKAAGLPGFDLSSLGTNGPSQDPAQVLDYLAGAGQAKKVGTATIRGAQTTRYRVTADLTRAKRATSTKAGKVALDQLLASLDGRKTVPVDVWIDGKHRVVRERVRYTAKIKDVTNTMDFTTDFTGFGVDVKAELPPGKDTVDGLELLRKAQAAQQQAG